jgi:hypothetical protein
MFTKVWVLPEVEAAYSEEYIAYLASKVTITARVSAEREKENDTGKQS